MKKQLIDQVDGFIFDMDGVLWRGNQATIDLSAFFSILNSKNKDYVFASNNSTKPVEKYIQRFNSFNVSISPDQIITSSIATAAYLRETFPQGSKLYVIGEEGIVTAVAKAGFLVSDIDPVAVIVGMDTTLTYEKLRKATLLIRKGIPFIGTNPDRSFPVPEGQIPGAGSILAALEASTGVKPHIIGKPFPLLFEKAFAQISSKMDKTIFVGDRLETDILGAKQVGFLTGLVLSGVSTRNDIGTSNIHPDFIAEDLVDLINLSIS